MCSWVLGFISISSWWVMVLVLWLILLIELWMVVCLLMMWLSVFDRLVSCMIDSVVRLSSSNSSRLKVRFSCVWMCRCCDSWGLVLVVM